MGSKETLPVLNLKMQYLNITKIAHILFTDSTWAQTEKSLEQILDDDTNNIYDCVSLDIRIKNEIIDHVYLWTESNEISNNDNIYTHTPFTAYDMCVMDAIYTIVSNMGKMVITIEYIARTLSSNTKQKITAQMISDIQKSIKKLASYKIKIDCSEEFSNRRDTKTNAQYDFEGSFLKVEEITIRCQVNGRIVKAYAVKEIPPLYEYAEILHQIVNMPADLLDTSGYFRDTTDAIVTKRYVARRAYQIIMHRWANKKISYGWHDSSGTKKGLFAELGYLPQMNDPDGELRWRTKTKPRINKVVIATLQNLMDKKLIHSYQPYRADGTNNPASPVMGYEIS